jgi:hypothetical protein
MFIEQATGHQPPMILARLLSDASTTGSIRRFGRRRFLSGASRKSCRRKVGRDRRVGQRAAGVRRYRSLTSRPADSKGSSSQGAMVFLGCTPGSTVVEHSTPNPKVKGLNPATGTGILLEFIFRPSWDLVTWDLVTWDLVTWDSVTWDSVSWDSVTRTQSLETLSLGIQILGLRHLGLNQLGLGHLVFGCSGFSHRCVSTYSIRGLHCHMCQNIG